MARKILPYILHTKDGEGEFLFYADQQDGIHELRFQICIPAGGVPWVDCPEMRAHADDVIGVIPPHGPVRLTIEEPLWRGHVWCREGREAQAVKWLRAAAHTMMRGLADGWLWSPYDDAVRAYSARHLPTT